MRHRRRCGGFETTAAALAGDSSVEIVQTHSPDMVTVEATNAAAGALRRRLIGTYYVEPEVRRGLN
jgi:hypothetical protein